jgi:hypothetical protein
MTTLLPSPTTAPEAVGSSPRRRTLVLLAVTYVLFFGVLMATSADNEPDTDAATLFASVDVNHLTIQVLSYAGLVACAVLVFFAAALRTHLAGRARPWTADVATLGFVVMALTLASWGVSSLAMWGADDLGDPTIIRAINLIDTANFLPAMVAMICAMLGAGLTGLRARTLPRWVAVASVVLGCLAPLGPGGFVPFLLFPLWMVVVAATVRVDEA